MSGLALGSFTTFDVSGYESWGFAGDPDNMVFAISATMSGEISGATLTNITWDVYLTTIGVSWADETTLTFTDHYGRQESINPAAGDAFTVTNMNYQGSAGSGLVCDPGLPIIMEIHEIGFDDFPGAVDSFFESGSRISLGNTGGKPFNLVITQIPAPGTGLVLGSVGLLAIQRRRRASR